MAPPLQSFSRPARAALAGGWVMAAAFAVYTALAHAGRRPFTDEGSICTLAMGILRGDVLYRDLVNEKAPFQYLLTALAFALGGEDYPTLRAVPTLAMIAVLGAIITFLQRESREAPHGPGLAAIAALGLAAPWFQTFHNLAEMTMAPLAVVALAAAGRAPTRSHPEAPPWPFLATGALLGLGLLTKQTFVWTAAAAAVLAPRGRPRRELLAAAGAMWLIGMLACSAWAGTFDIWRETLGTPFRRGSGALVYARGMSTFEWQGFAVLGLATAGFWAWERRHSPASRWRYAVALLLAAGLPRMDLFRLWPAACVLAFAIARLAMAALPRPRRAAMGALLFAGLVAAATRGPADTADFGALRDIAIEIKRRVPPGGTIWVGPHEPNLYCLTKLPPASRYTFALPWAPGGEALDELAATLAAKPPAVIVDAGAMHAQVPLAVTAPALDRLLQERYSLATQIHRAKIYTRRPDGAAP